MSSSASSISPRSGHEQGKPRSEHPTRPTHRHGAAERLIARVLVAAIVTGQPLSATAGSEFTDADNTTFDASKVQLDNTQAGRTTFTIGVDHTSIGWQELQQPENNRLEFIFSNGGGKNASVLNYGDSINGMRLSGQVHSNGTVAFANRYGVYIDETAVIDVGSLVAIAANVPREAFEQGRPIELDLRGRVENHGLIRADRNVALLATSVLNAGEILAGNGQALLVGGERIELGDLDLLRSGLDGERSLEAELAGGDVTNTGRLEAKNAALLSGRVVNLGEIAIEDGSLLMVGGDAVYLTRFDNPVLIRLPKGSVESGSESSNSGSDAEGARYAIENHGRIDAGRGHVRLAAADPLGFGIRQGSGTRERPAEIRAREIVLEGGEEGRVQLSGKLDASDDSKKGRGGEIDVAGDLIVLADASLDASGTRGGGQIRVGGEQQGSGDFQRASVVVMDAESEIRADANRQGDGGRVIVFSEDLTSLDGEISARGGHRGGNGGFVETSGLRHFAISGTPDVSAPRGRAGSWLIDPYDITIQNSAPDCAGDPRAATCLDDAIDAILDPDFDSVGFDGIIRTTGPTTNFISADLIERALGVGTNVTLSTQAFLDDPVNGAGDIRIVDAIAVDSLRVLAGTQARLTLLAAGNIYVDADIAVLPIGAGPSERSNLRLSVELHANDSDQTKAGRDFGRDLVSGGVEIGADIRTGGGSFTATGISVRQSATSEIVTRGGDVAIRTGTISPIRLPFSEGRDRDDATLDDDLDATPGEAEDTDGLTAIDPLLELLGLVDTRTADGRRDGGDVVLTASSANVGVLTSGRDPVEVVTGLLRVVGDIFTGGGDATLTAGTIANSEDNVFAGNVEMTGNIDTTGGDGPVGGHVAIRANRVNPETDSRNFDVTSLAPTNDADRGQGGAIAIDGSITTGGGSLAIGNDSARSISLDGSFDTTSSNPRENGLIQLIARDSTATNDDDGDGVDDLAAALGRIEIGTNGGTTIETAGLALRTGELTMGVSGGANAVDVTLSGRSTSSFFDVAADDDPNNDGDTGDAPAIGVLDFAVRKFAEFFRNTELSADTIEIGVAESPLDLGTGERANAETRLVFEGTNGGAAAAADGVRLAADTIRLAVGDGATATSNLFADDEGTLAAPTDLGVQRQTRGDYQGLQLRDRTGALRPEAVEIRQDGGLTISQGPATQAGQLDLAGAFGNALIGSAGLTLSLESSDGVLRVEDAAGFNNNAGPLGAGDAGKSFVTLRGGLLLPASPGGTNPDPETVTTANSVVFGVDADSNGIGDSALGSGGTTAFDVERLEVSTPGDFTLVQQIADSIASAFELVFRAGRETGSDATAGRGTLQVAAGLSIGAQRQLSLLAGDAGFGDLVFAGAGTTLAADEIELQAGPTGESRNADANDRSRIVGLRSQNVALRDAAGALFGDAASSATAFRYRQAAGIDAATDLPSLLQFGLADVGPTAGFRVAGDVEYAVRSDRGTIDLDDGVVGTNEADVFRNASLSLIGLQSGSAAAIAVSADTAFVGKQVELGSVEGFTFTGALARAFNRDGTDAGQSLTLRSGVGGLGNLGFTSDGGAPVVVKAPTVRLIAGDGSGDGTGSTLNTTNASFDLAGPVGAARTFAYQMDGTFRVQDLPSVDRFVGGAAGLPTVLAIRNDGGRIEIDDFDAAELPIAVAGGPARLVLESDTIALNQTDGDDLQLTTNPNLFMRLRANVLSLIASVSSNTDTESGRVRMGPRGADTQLTTGADADFDGESLLVEAFDAAAEFVTTGNLSALSEEPEDSGNFDLAAGRGPTSLTLTQDGSVQAIDLAHRNSFSGLLRRVLEDDEEELPVATTYQIESLLGSVEVTPENVNGSQLVLRGTASDPTLSAIDFAPGGGANPGLFELDRLDARTEESIAIRAGTRLIATDSLTLQAGAGELPDEAITTVQGSLRFLGGHADGQVTRLEANQISLIAGPGFTLTNPDADRDGERDEIADALLPKLDLAGLDELALAGDVSTSALRLRQNANFDVRRGQAGDFLTALEAGAAGAGAGGAEWDELEVASFQGELRLSEIGLLADESRFMLAQTGRDGRIVVDMPDQADRPAPFDDFAEGAELRSNDITFQSTDPGTSIDLATDRLLLSSLVPAILVDASGRLRSQLEQGDEEDQDAVRPIVRIHQAAAFTNTELPRPNQYGVIDLDGTQRLLSDLSTLDIELRTTAPATTLTLDDAIRERTTGSNLILRSAGDVAIALTGLTTGYEDILDGANNPAYAALQLTSLDIEAQGGAGTIRIAPFASGFPSVPELTLETEGDQRFGGRLALENSLRTTGRDLTFAGDIVQSGNPNAGLTLGLGGCRNSGGCNGIDDDGRFEGIDGKVRFEGNIGTATDRLAHLRVYFDGQSGSGQDASTPNVEFGRRIDDDDRNGIADADGIGDEIAETPVASTQSVFVRDDVRFRSAYDRAGGIDQDIVNGRKRPANFATVGKALGDLAFDVDAPNGVFETTAGEKISVGGTLSIDAPSRTTLSDVSALIFRVTSFALELLPRGEGVTLDRTGQTHGDGGPSISANELDLNVLAFALPGGSRVTRFGVPDPYALGNDFRFPAFAVRPKGRSLTTADFVFTDRTGPLAEQVAFVVPTGASRSDLSGANGPIVVPTSKIERSDPAQLVDPGRLRALAIETRATPDDVVLARLTGVAVIDDRALASTGKGALVTESRLDARDAEAAIALHGRLFGPQGEGAPHVRGVLQQALDSYLETSNSQRVVGFELRRFVKNRPSTLIEAYTTLDDLDALFRYHRRLGLSPGEFKRIQRGWLEQIQPDGISVDELAEAIHPSRYVRGSDILDIFGQ